MEQELAVVLAFAVATFAAIVQRVTGLGFALVATPPLVLLFGPNEGVKVVVLLGVVASGLMLISMFRDVDFRRTWLLTWSALLGAPVAALVVAKLSSSYLMLLVGAAAIFSLLAGKIPGLKSLFNGRKGGFVAGTSAGFLHVTSGLSGPPLIAYAANESWNRQSFVASMQLLFVIYHLMTLGFRGLPEISLPMLGYLAATVGLGVLAGSKLSQYIPVKVAQSAMIVTAWIGSIVVLLRGVSSLL